MIITNALLCEGILIVRRIAMATAQKISIILRTNSAVNFLYIARTTFIIASCLLKKNDYYII